MTASGSGRPPGQPRPDDEAVIGRAFQRLNAALEQSPSGWSGRVLATVDRPAPQPRSWWRRLAVVVVLVPVAAAAMLLLVIRRPPDPPGLTLVASVVPGNGQLRGGPAAVGDTLVLGAGPVGADRAVVLLVYRDDTLVFSCSGDCRRRGGDRIEARVPLATIGRYWPLLVTGPSPPPRVSGRREADVVAFRQGGWHLEEAPPIDVH